MRVWSNVGGARESRVRRAGGGGCENEVRAPGGRPACSEPALRHGRFEVWVVLRRECAESIRAGKSLYFPRKPDICPQLSPILSSLIITLQWGSGPYMLQS